MPTTRTEVRCFLGKTGYYRKFIRDYSAIAAPLHEKLKQDGTGDRAVFQPTAQMIQAVRKLKARLIQAPILAYPRFDSDHRFILDTDFSCDNMAMGAVLSQVQDGKERVIAYDGQRLSASQRNYSAQKGEMLATIYFMRKFSYFLRHRPFTLRVDNAALRYLKTMEAPRGMLARWLETLSAHDFDIQHRPGKSHGNADALSRAPHLPPADGSTDLSAGEIHQLQPGLRPPPEEEIWTPEAWQQAQAADEDLAPLLQAVRRGTPPTEQQVKAASRVGKIYSGLYDSLVLDDEGVLAYRQPQPNEDERFLRLVPVDWWLPAMRKAHEAAAHMAAVNTTERAQKSIFFPGMLRCAQQVVRECHACQQKGRPKDQRHTLVSHQYAYPFQKLSIDFVGPLPASNLKHRYILTVVDCFSKWLEAFPLRHATAEAAADCLTKEIFPRFGLPEGFHSDRGSQFTANLTRDVASILGVQATVTPAYNPKSNPVERSHRDLEKAITALVEKHVRNWHVALPHVLFAMRTTRSKTTGYAPYRLLFGRDPSTPLELLFGSPIQHKEYSDYHEYAQALQHHVQAAHAWARKHIGRAVERQRRAYHKDKKHFTVGQKVWLFTPKLQVGQSSKLATYWTGPWTIQRRANALMYEIRPHTTWQRKANEVVSVDRLKLYYEQEEGADGTTAPPPVDADLRMRGDEHAEFLMTTDQEDDDDEDQEPPPPPQPRPPSPRPATPPPRGPPPAPPRPPGPGRPRPPPRRPPSPDGRPPPFPPTMEEPISPPPVRRSPTEPPTQPTTPPLPQRATTAPPVQRSPPVPAHQPAPPQPPPPTPDRRRYRSAEQRTQEEARAFIGEDLPPRPHQPPDRYHFVDAGPDQEPTGPPQGAEAVTRTAGGEAFTFSFPKRSDVRFTAKPRATQWTSGAATGARPKTSTATGGARRKTKPAAKQRPEWRSSPPAPSTPERPTTPYRSQPLSTQLASPGTATERALPGYRREDVPPELRRSTMTSRTPPDMRKRDKIPRTPPTRPPKRDRGEDPEEKDRNGRPRRP